MLVNKMIRSGLVIQSNGVFGGYPSNHDPSGRWGTDSTIHPSTLPNQFDTGFQTTKTISPFQQTIGRALPNSVFRLSKADYFLKNVNSPRGFEPMYDDIFGSKSNELVDYVKHQIGTSESAPSSVSENQGGYEGLIGNTLPDTKVNFLINQELSSLPPFIRKIVDEKIRDLPTYTRLEIISQLNDLPRLIETNSIGYKDLDSIINLIIEESTPKTVDIFTNQTAITDIPQQTEDGTVYVSIPHRSFESQKQVVSDIPLLRDEIRQIRQKKKMTEDDLDRIDELENEIKLLMSLVNATNEYLTK